MEYEQNVDPHINDGFVASLPPASLINAIGLGKDVPGLPITAAITFLEGGIACELNYRGALDFLHQARAQQEARVLSIEDG